jgi:hypothetical protein
LPDCREYEFPAQVFGYPIGEAQPVEPRRCENQRVKLTLVELSQSSVDVAAHRFDHQIAAHRAKLSLAAEAASANPRSLRKLVERADSFASNKRVAHVLALADCAYLETDRKLGWQIFQAVDGQIHTPFQDRFLEFFGEQALALLTQRWQRNVQHSITFSRDDFDVHLDAGMAALNLALDPVGLPQCEFATAGPDCYSLDQGSVYP